MNKPLVVITGASSGIGKELAFVFNKKGYPLLLLARRKNILDTFNLENTINRSVDVTDYKAFQQAVIEAEEIYGPADLIINNAGIMPLETIDMQPLEDQNKIIDVNIKGVLNGMNIVIPNMKKNNHGTIINVSSVAGRWTYGEHAVYCASKFAVHSLSEQSRKELAKYNIRVLICAPAIVDTNLLSSVTNPEILKNYENVKKQINKGLNPKDLANIICYTYELPQSISVKEIVVSATKQAC